MRITIVLAAVLTSFVVNGGKLCAQESDEAQCDRAWQASDWATVSTACANVAGEKAAETDRLARTISAAIPASQYTPAQKQTLETGAVALAVGSAYGAREAIGFYKLNRPDLYAPARTGVIQALSVAVDQLRIYGTPEEVAKFSALLQLVQSEKFPDEAPSSNLLAGHLDQ